MATKKLGVVNQCIRGKFIVFKVLIERMKSLKWMDTSSNLKVSKLNPKKIKGMTFKKERFKVGKAQYGKDANSPQTDL